MSRNVLMLAYARACGYTEVELRDAMSLAHRKIPEKYFPLDPLWPYVDEKDTVVWLSVSQAEYETPDFMAILNGYARYLDTKG